MMHKAWCSIKDVPYNFSGSSIKFWGHTGWKIDVWNAIWVRLLGWSQLSNPSDLPCSRLSNKAAAHIITIVCTQLLCKNDLYVSHKYNCFCKETNSPHEIFWEQCDKFSYGLNTESYVCIHITFIPLWPYEENSRKFGREISHSQIAW